MNPTRTDTVYEMSKRESGVSRQDVVRALSITGQQASYVIQNLQRQHKIFIAEAECQKARHFSTKVAAEAWLAKQSTNPIDGAIAALIKSVNYAGTEAISKKVRINYSTAIKRLNAMELQGLVCHLKVGHMRYWFLSQEDRKAFLADKEKRKQVRAEAEAERKRQKRAEEKTLVVEKRGLWPEQKLISERREDGVLVTRAAPVFGDRRVHVQPGEKVPKLFRKLPLGATLCGVTA